MNQVLIAYGDVEDALTVNLQLGAGIRLIKALGGGWEVHRKSVSGISSTPITWLSHRSHRPTALRARATA
jgi:hypothetical protein